MKRNYAIGLLNLVKTVKHHCLVMIMGSEGQIKSRSQGCKTRGQGLGCLECLSGWSFDLHSGFDLFLF